MIVVTFIELDGDSYIVWIVIYSSSKWHILIIEQIFDFQALQATILDYLDYVD